MKTRSRLQDNFSWKPNFLTMWKYFAIFLGKKCEFWTFLCEKSANSLNFQEENDNFEQKNKAWCLKKCSNADSTVKFWHFTAILWELYLLYVRETYVPARRVFWRLLHLLEIPPFLDYFHQPLMKERHSLQSKGPQALQLLKTLFSEFFFISRSRYV